MASTNRWRIPIGAVAVHICIGSVYAWSTFNRPIQALFPGPALVVQPAVYDVHDGAGTARPERGVRRSVGRAAWPARGGHRRRAVFRHWADHRRRRPGAAATGAGVSRHGRDWRHRLRPWLHLAGQHAREVVSRPPRHGDRHGDHGIRRRRVPRRLSQRLFHGSDWRRQHGDRARRDISRRSC